MYEIHLLHFRYLFFSKTLAFVTRNVHHSSTTPMQEGTSTAVGRPNGRWDETKQKVKQDNRRWKKTNQKVEREKLWSD